MIHESAANNEVSNSTDGARKKAVIKTKSKTPSCGTGSLLSEKVNIS